MNASTSTGPPPTPTASDPPAVASRSATTVAFAWRTALRLKHTPEQFSDVVAIPVVFTLMFTYLLGGALAGSPSVYLRTLLPGTLVMAVALLTTFTGIGLRGDLDSGVHDRYRSLPVWRPAVSLSVIFPLTIASNVFADPVTMPGWLQPIVEHNPISLVVTATRGLMHGDAAMTDVAWGLAVSAAVVAVFLPLSLYRYRTHRW